MNAPADTLLQPHTTPAVPGSRLSDVAVKHLCLIPAIAAILYPLPLDWFHAAVGAPDSGVAISYMPATFALLAAFAVPAIGILFAWKVARSVSMRRLAYVTVAAPTAYVFMGVVTYMVKSKLPDELIWAVLWLILAGIAYSAPKQVQVSSGLRDVSRWRVTHGVAAAVVAAYIAFHIINHLFVLAGFAVHDKIAAIGEVVYRNPVVQPILVLLFIFLTITGMRLFWHWSAQRGDIYRTFQLAAGMFLLVYVIGHMDSAFVFQRSYVGGQTDILWANGGPAGMIHHAWNIRLLPHYLLGVFFVLAHLACGTRGILLAHHDKGLIATGVSAGARYVTAVNYAWVGTIAFSMLVAVVIILGMVAARP